MDKEYVYKFKKRYRFMLWRLDWFCERQRLLGNNKYIFYPGEHFGLGKFVCKSRKVLGFLEGYETKEFSTRKSWTVLYF